MKRSLLALAVLTAFAGAASAQSSVTVFGVVDLSLKNVKNGDNDINSMSTDGNASNRLGFRGVEDLGGGLRAGFWIEGAMAPDTGTATGQTWQRRSTVSLLGGFGELRLGRDYTPWFWNHTVFDPFGTNGVGSNLNVFGQASTLSTTLVRANNTVGYFLPSLGGVYGQVQVAAAESTTGNKSVGGRIGYAGGPVNVALAYGKTEKTGAMVDDVIDTNVGFSWNFGFMNLIGLYRMSEYAAAKNTGFMVGLTVPIGAGTIKASYSDTEYDNGTSAPKVNQVALGYVYDLSKRTALFAHYAVVDNETGRANTIAGGPAAVGTGFKSTGYEFGIRHSF